MQSAWSSTSTVTCAPNLQCVPLILWHGTVDPRALAGQPFAARSRSRLAAGHRASVS